MLEHALQLLNTYYKSKKGTTSSSRSSSRGVEGTGAVTSFIVLMLLYAFLFLAYTLAVIDYNQADDMLLLIRLEDTPDPLPFNTLT